MLIPCHNEELSIARVVRDFADHLPGASVYVYDNKSSDLTSEVAAQAGGLVRTEPRRGKGNVVQRMFADIEAEIYVLVDGDDTYDASAAPRAVHEMLLHSLDMVNIARTTDSSRAYPPGHRFGNIVLTGVVATLFGRQFRDMLSGFKVLSRRFVKSLPLMARGFEVETEITVHALHMRVPVSEIEAPYRERPPGSTSKLRTIRDGIGILSMIMVLLRDERPLLFFCSIASVLALTSLLLAWPLAVDYLQTGLVLRIPTAILCTGLMLLAFLGGACGLILDTVARARWETKRLHYMSPFASTEGQCRPPTIRDVEE